MNWLKRLTPYAALAAFLVCAAAATPSLRRAASSERSRVAASQDDGALRTRNESAFASILGEVRATAADLMFMKTSRYLHAGVAYAPTKLNLTADRKNQRFVGCDAGVPTLIRSAQEDFRGFLGDLERHVKPYRPASAEHQHTEMAELIPWFRLMTLTNPQYVRGYRVGMSALIDQDEWKEAWEFLQEGIANNPDNSRRFLLFQSLCSYHVRGQYAQGKYPFGDQWVDRALAAAREAYRLGLRQRPPGGQTGKIARDIRWNEDLEEDFCYAAHMVPLLLARKGDTPAARRAALEAAKYLPDYAPLARTIERLGARRDLGDLPSAPAHGPEHEHDHEHEHHHGREHSHDHKHERPDHAHHDAKETAP